MEYTAVGQYRYACSCGERVSTSSRATRSGARWSGGPDEYLIQTTGLDSWSTIELRSQPDQAGLFDRETAPNVRKLLGDGVDEPVVLGVHRGGIGPVIDRVQQRLDPRPGRFRRRGHQLRRVVGAAPLPRRSGQGGADRLDQAAVRVGGD